MTTVPVDYATAYFEYPVLDKIHGEPTWEALRYLKKQLKVNAKTVISDLGGEQHGHLGLVLSQIEYALLSNEPYVRPLHPAPLVTPQGTTHHESMRLTKEHGEDIRLFREMLDAEKALIKQIVAAIGKDYLKELCNAGTDTIIISISQSIGTFSHCLWHGGFRCFR